MIFSHSSWDFPGSWEDGWFFFYWNLNIWGMLWDSGSQFKLVLSGFLCHYLRRWRGIPPWYFQVLEKVQFPRSAPVITWDDTGSHYCWAGVEMQASREASSVGIHWWVEGFISTADPLLSIDALVWFDTGWWAFPSEASGEESACQCKRWSRQRVWPLGQEGSLE